MKLTLSIDGIPLLEEELLSVAEAAKLLGKPKVWVYRRVKEGKIKTIMADGLILIRRFEIEPARLIGAKEIPTTRGQLKPEDINIKNYIEKTAKMIGKIQSAASRSIIYDKVSTTMNSPTVEENKITGPTPAVIFDKPFTGLTLDMSKQPKAETD